ncbi:MAG: hypothetical protein MI920_33495 [Kiloniellales bacterium]|nr:hypothetical protein [Kiloniellales bacterium]
MKVEKSPFPPDEALLRESLSEVVLSPGTARPVCGPACELARRQDCSPACPALPQALSSDPEKHPIEDRIAPLVFVLKQLAVFEPCWSCEGHNDGSGQLWKSPQIWFYARAEVYARLLADCLTDLTFRNLLSARWQVAVLQSDPNNPATTFALQPAFIEELPTLSTLQADIDGLVAQLPARYRERAAKLLHGVS